MSNPKSMVRGDGCMSVAVGGTLSSCRARILRQHRPQAGCGAVEARHHFTTLHQVDQLIEASEAELAETRRVRSSRRPRPRPARRPGARSPRRHSPARLQPRDAQPGASARRGGCRRVAARESAAGRRQHRRPRAGHRALVSGAKPLAQRNGYATIPGERVCKGLRRAKRYCRIKMIGDTVLQW